MTQTPPQSQEEAVREAVKRFCRTDEAADNLVAYIMAYATEARIDELKRINENSDETYVGDDWFVDDNIRDKTGRMVPQGYLDDRIAQLKTKDGTERKDK